MEQHERSESKYATKVRSGKQMYGPGCCAHRLTHVEINTATKLDDRGQRHLIVARTPAKYLPRFTTEKTRRAIK